MTTATKSPAKRPRRAKKQQQQQPLTLADLHPRVRQTALDYADGNVRRVTVMSRTHAVVR